MTAAVSLNKFIFEMDSLGYVAHVYFNRNTGEFLTITDDQLRYAEQDNDDDAPEDERESLPKVREVLASADWIELPSKWDMDDTRVMERFCTTVEDPKVRDALLAAVRGPGHVGRFKTALQHHDLEKRWYAFREQAMRQIAVDWLKENAIEFQD